MPAPTPPATNRQRLFLASRVLKSSPAAEPVRPPNRLRHSVDMDGNSLLFPAGSVSPLVRTSAVSEEGFCVREFRSMRFSTILILLSWTRLN